MGFGEKTDFKTNRTLDLDKTYRIVRDAVEEAGFECIRADDIVHSGIIDKPMYEHLLNADVAIAHLSTSNENAIYASASATRRGRTRPSSSPRTSSNFLSISTTC